MKKCNICNQEKSLDSFYKDKRGKFGVYARCKICFNTISSIKYKENPEKFKLTISKYLNKNPLAKRNARIAYMYKLSEEDYNKIHKKQKGKCAICGKLEKELNRNLDVDHCHTTKVVRGLLCNSCNRGLGFFKDNPIFLKKAANYLKK